MLTRIVISALAIVLATGTGVADTVVSDWERSPDRTWIGRDWFANRLQDWRLRDGRVECVVADPALPLRTLHLLTGTLSATPGTAQLRVELGAVEQNADGNPESWAGLLIGAGGAHVDHRLSALVHHRPAEDGGLLVLVDGHGRVDFRDNAAPPARGGLWSVGGALAEGEVPAIEAHARRDPGVREGRRGSVRLSMAALTCYKVYTGGLKWNHDGIWHPHAELVAATAHHDPDLRRACAMHIAGDQHLGAVIQYGLDDWRDAPFAFSTPSIANTWPRRWYPPTPGANRAPGAPRYCGDFLDGSGNRMTVLAVANPIRSGREPARLYDRAPGYGIVRFDRHSRDITIEWWPRWVDPADPEAMQYPGWPIVLNQLDNAGSEHALTLRPIFVHGMTDPVVQVIDEETGVTEYTVRIAGTSFRPWVERRSTYTVIIGEPGTPRMRTLTGLFPEDARPPILIDFTATD